MKPVQPRNLIRYIALLPLLTMLFGLSTNAYNISKQLIIEQATKEITALTYSRTEGVILEREVSELKIDLRADVQEFRRELHEVKNILLRMRNNGN